VSQTLCWTMFEAREPASTIKFVDDYCQWYRKLFPEVRSFEAFKYLHVGMISDIKRKTLPAISRLVGLSNELLTITFPQRVALAIGAAQISKIKANPTSIGRTRNYTNY
jgi:SRSO17 transposase